MVVLILTFLAIVLASPAPGTANALTAQEAASGWILLFDGKTMNGWDDPSKKTPSGESWSVDDGTLHSRSNPRLLEDLLTTRTFRNFELVFEWRVAIGGNSGVKYRIQDRLLLVDGKLNPGSKVFEDTVDYEYAHRLGQRSQLGAGDRAGDYPIAFEYQVIDNERHSDALRGPKQTAGALYGMVAPARQTAKPAGEWNTARIILEGKHVEHWLNGVKVVDTRLDDAEIAASLEKRWGKQSPVYKLLTTQPKLDCPIGLQNHNDEAWFRNIKLRPL